MKTLRHAVAVRTCFVTTLCAILLIVAGGCGVSSPRYALDETEHDRIANAFMIAVRGYYAKRTEGTLSEPGIGDERVRFVYRYGMIINGQQAEEVHLDFHKRHSVMHGEMGEGNVEPASFGVGAWYRREGPDPEIPAVRDAIIAGMQAQQITFAPVK